MTEKLVNAPVYVPVFTADSHFEKLSPATEKAHFTSDGTDTTHIVAEGPTVLHFVLLVNNDHSPRYLKLYDQATEPNIEVDLPSMTIMVPAGNTTSLPIGPAGVVFNDGLAIVYSTGSALTDNSPIGAGLLDVSIAHS